MDIVINKSPDVNIHVSRSAPVVKIGAPQSINMQMTHQVVNIRPHKPASPRVSVCAASRERLECGQMHSRRVSGDGVV